LRGNGAPAPRSEAQIVADAAPAVGRLQAVDPSGRVVALGLAFAIDKGVLATACQGLAPGMELVLRIGTRDVHARPARVDPAKGYCTLDAPNAGSWPLGPARFPPRVGDKVYAVRIGEHGEPALAAGSIRRIASASALTVVEVTGTASAAAAGSPLVDAQGGVIALGDGTGRYVKFDPRDASSS